MPYHIGMITHGWPLVNQLSALVGQVDDIQITRSSLLVRAYHGNIVIMVLYPCLFKEITLRPDAVSIH